MTLLHASLALAGIATIAIPIIIHLLMHRRRKPVMWGAMRFLLEAYRRQRRRLMLEKWLLLLCRCLVLALFALAIGRPLLGKLGGQNGGRTLYLLIDNGLASGLKADADQGRTALERHKQSAKSAIAALRRARGPGGAISEGDRVALIALGGPAEALVLPPSPDLASVERLIDDLAPTDSRTDVQGGLQLVAEDLSRSRTSGSSASSPVDPSRAFVALLSDFREGSIDLTQSAAASPAATDAPLLSGVRLPAGVTLLASPPQESTLTANISIIGLEPLRSVVVGDWAGAAGAEGAADLVRVHLRRSGPELSAAKTTIQTRVLPVDSEAPASAEPAAPIEAAARTEVQWTAGQDSAMIVASIPRPSARNPGQPNTQRSGSGLIVASIDPDSLPADNTWRRPVEFRTALRVGVIGPTRFSDTTADKLDPSSWARLALAPIGDTGSTTGGGGGGGIELVDIDPASIDSARLAGLDAVVLPRPDLVQDSSWVRLGLFMSSGGVVVVAPPPALAIHLWPDAMIKGLGLPPEWSIPRESRSVEGVRLVAPVPTMPQSPGASPDQAPPDLLGLVRGELDELVRPITLRTALPLEATGDAGRVLLSLESGPAVMWAGRPAPKDTSNTAGLLVYLGVAFSLDWSDLPAKPLMVPLMQETIRQGVGQAHGAWWSVAGARPTAPGHAVELREIPSAASAADTSTPPSAPPALIAVDASGSVSRPIRRAGAYRAIDERGGSPAVIAINPDPRAGRVLPQPRAAIAALLASAVTPASDAPESDGRADSIVWLDGASGAPRTASANSNPETADTLASLFGGTDRGSPIDFPLLIAALALAIAEVALARWASHADVGRAAAGAPAGASTDGLPSPAGRAAA